MSLLDRITDRIHARHDAAARVAGLTVVRLPGGRRQISHPDLPDLFEARRRRIITDGPDAADLAFMDPDTRQALLATLHRMRLERDAATTPRAPSAPADLTRQAA